MRGSSLQFNTSAYCFDSYRAYLSSCPLANVAEAIEQRGGWLGVWPDLHCQQIRWLLVCLCAFLYAVVFSFQSGGRGVVVRDALFCAKWINILTFLQSCEKCDTAEHFSDSQFHARCTACCSRNVTAKWKCSAMGALLMWLPLVSYHTLVNQNLGTRTSAPLTN